MKYLFVGLSIIAVAVTYFFGSPKPKTHHVIVLIDITSEDIPSPTAKDVFNAAALTSEWNSAAVTIGLIHEFGISEMKTTTLPFIPWYARNTLKRRNELAQFESSIETILQEVSSIPKGRSHSVIISRIRDALETIPDEEPGVVLVYSDLLEHSDFLNAYESLPLDNILYERVASLFDVTRHHTNHSVILIPPLRNISEAKTHHTLSRILTEVISHMGGSVSVRPEESF